MEGIIYKCTLGDDGELAIVCLLLVRFYASMAFRKHLLYPTLLFSNYYLETLGATKFSKAIIRIVSR
jgi:hypothetical protein